MAHYKVCVDAKKKKQDLIAAERCLMTIKNNKIFRQLLTLKTHKQNNLDIQMRTDNQGYKQRTINTDKQKKETRQQATQLQLGV